MAGPLVVGRSRLAPDQRQIRASDGTLADVMDMSAVALDSSE
jgi:hypothetical protein